MTLKIEKVKTVKFEALKMMKEAYSFLVSAELSLGCAEELNGDNEVKEFTKALRLKISCERWNLARGIIESEENW
jgi:hypothetical protein